MTDPKLRAEFEKIVTSISQDKDFIWRINHTDDPNDEWFFSSPTAGELAHRPDRPIYIWTEKSGDYDNFTIEEAFEIWMEILSGNEPRLS